MNRQSARIVLCLGAALTLGLAATPARAQTKLEARYTATLAGIPLGSGVWIIEIAPDQYTAVASGHTTGLVKLIADGSGTSGARGTFHGAQIISGGFVQSINSDKRVDEVRMSMTGGNVKEAIVDPPLPPSPDRVPVTEAHRKGVIDPMSAMIIPVAGTGDPVSPDVCKRRLAIFDGRQRADIELVFKRMDQVKAEKGGYAGPVAVCQALYHPIAGHRPERSAIKYLVAQRDMEIWFAPIAGTRVMVPFRFFVPTPFGAGVLQATSFVTAPRGPQAAQTTPPAAKTQ